MVSFQSGASPFGRSCRSIASDAARPTPKPAASCETAPGTASRASGSDQRCASQSHGSRHTSAGASTCIRQKHRELCTWCAPEALEIPRRTHRTHARNQELCGGASKNRTCDTSSLSGPAGSVSRADFAGRPDLGRMCACFALLARRAGMTPLPRRRLYRPARRPSQLGRRERRTRNRRTDGWDHESARFGMTRDVRAERVLLLDDTFVSGASRFSASAALHAAGATLVGPVVTGGKSTVDGRTPPLCWSGSEVGPGTAIAACGVPVSGRTLGPASTSERSTAGTVRRAALRRNVSLGKWRHGRGAR